MKTILVILDGVSEEKVDELNKRTPLEYADTPILNEIIKYGCHKKTKFYPNDRNPDSLNCILSILGVKEIPKNRTYLEAIASNIKINESEVALRCNLVSIKNGKLESFNGKDLSTDEMKFVYHNVKTRKDVKFYNISSYRNILTLSKSQINCVNEDMPPPHEFLGESIDVLLQHIRGNNIINDFIEQNKFTINNTDYMLYPWGISEVVNLPTFYELHNKSCSCICNAEIVKGIAKIMKIDTPLLKNSTGDVDTDLKEKADAAIREIQSHDVVIAHINGTDEVSHRKDLFGKIRFIEKIDKEFLKPIYKQIKHNIKLIIVADHQTSSITGKHEKGLVDIIVSNK